MTDKLQESRLKQLVKQYINIIFRWAWLLVLATLLTTGVAYAVSKGKPTMYEASARLIIGPGIDGINPGLNDLRTGGQLMQTYAELIATQPVLQKVISELKLNVDPDTLKLAVNVKTDDATQLLTIRVQDNDSAKAVKITDALANALVGMSPSGGDSAGNQIRLKIGEQIKKMDQNSGDIEAKIKKYEAQLQTSLTTPTDVETRRIIQDQLAQQRTNLSDTQRTLAALFTTYQGSATNQVKIIEMPPLALPVDSNLHLKLLVAALAGLILASTIVFAFEYFNDTIRTTEDLASVTDIPLLGTIAKHKPLRGKVRERLVVQALSESRAAENYRMLGSKLLLSRYQAEQNGQRGVGESNVAALAEQLTTNATRPLHSVVLSSTQVSEDTSEIIANLAVILAQTGHRVILVDAYLHRPTISQQFGIVDDEGLTSVLAGWSKTPKLIPVDWTPNLSILPSGPIPPNPFDLLVSARMANLIKELESQADIVLIAASPLLSFADSLILASRADGVIILLRSARASRDTVREIVKSLRSLNAHILGTIFDYNPPARLPASAQRPVKANFALMNMQPAKTPIGFLKSAKS